MSVDVALTALNRAYFHALDTRDFEAIAACFTEDARATYLDGRWQMTGRHEIVDRLRAIENFASSIHVIGTSAFAAITGGAQGDVFAIAHLVTRDDPCEILVRGLRYRDRYRDSETGWQVAAREQIVLWQHRAAGEAPSIGTAQDPA